MYNSVLHKTWDMQILIWKRFRLGSWTADKVLFGGSTSAMLHPIKHIRTFECIGREPRAWQASQFYHWMRHTMLWCGTTAPSYKIKDGFARAQPLMSWKREQISQLTSCCLLQPWCSNLPGWSAEDRPAALMESTPSTCTQLQREDRHMLRDVCQCLWMSTPATWKGRKIRTGSKRRGLKTRLQVRWGSFLWVWSCSTWTDQMVFPCFDLLKVVCFGGVQVAPNIVTLPSFIRTL